MYPGGYIYLFSLLYYLTDKGKNIFVSSFHSPQPSVESLAYLLSVIPLRDLNRPQDLSPGHPEASHRLLPALRPAMHLHCPPCLLTEGPLDIHPEMLQRLLRRHFRLPRCLPADEEPRRPSPCLSVPRDFD